MNIAVTTFHNPFSFFCIAQNNDKNISLCNQLEPNNIALHTKSELSDIQHGQYIAVMWENKWARGIVSLESQFLIWLIDFGIYLRPNEKTVYVNLPSEYKKLPTKVFEASIHGVIPVDKVLSNDCQIKDEICKSWNKGAIEKAQNLIVSAKKVYFMPVALLSTEHNDIVLGDLYFETENKKIDNIINELELWPMFLQKNSEAYIKSLSMYYTSRRRHRACLVKPHLPYPNLPTISFGSTLDEYNGICAQIEKLDVTPECDSDTEDDSTVIGQGGNFIKDKEQYNLTPAEIEKYAHMYVHIHGRDYNVLNVLLNKIRDMKMCDRYKDHDLKCVGRGVTRLLD